MFGNLFRKTEPRSFIVERPGYTKVLLFPIKFQNNDVLNQQFTNAERRKLHKIFDEERLLHIFEDQTGLDGDEDYVRFQADFVSMGEVFQTKTDDLRAIDRHEIGSNEADDWYEVREFEFFVMK
jgi:hypothetical protein